MERRWKKEWLYGIAKQSGGNILVDSGVGKGTTFKLYLPRELSATQPAPTRPQPPLCRARGNETVLVVEDEAAVRLLTTRLLKKAGYRVLNAADGEQALLASEQHPDNIHLLLTDLVMPRMGGRLLAERLARLRPALKILYMSGYTDDAIVRHGVMDVRTQLLAKPFSEAELTRKVRAVLDGMLVTSGTNWPAIPEASQERPLAAPRALSRSDSAQPGRRQSARATPGAGRSMCKAARSSSWTIPPTTCGS